MFAHDEATDRNRIDALCSREIAFKNEPHVAGRDQRQTFLDAECELNDSIVNEYLRHDGLR